MRGLRPQAEAAVVLADRVRELRAAGHDEQRMARARPRAIAVHSARSAPSPASRAEPAADLDDGQHDARSAGGRELGERGRGRRVALRLAPRQLDARGRPRRSRHRAGEERPDPERHDRRRASAKRVLTCRAAASIWRDLLGVEIRGDRLDLARRSSCSASAQTSRATRSRAHSTLAARPSGVGHV